MTAKERIYVILDQKGYTVADLCRATGVKSNTVAGWKKTNTTPPAKYLVIISDFLNTSIDYLLTGKERSAQTSSCVGTEEEKASTLDEKKMLRWFRQLDECDQTILIGRAAKMVQLKKTEESEEDEETSPVFSAIRNHSKNRV